MGGDGLLFRLWPGLCPGRRVHAAHRDRRARDQCRIGVGRGAAVPRRGRRPGGFPRTHAVGLLHRGHLDAGCAARRRRGCAAGHRGGLSRPAPGPRGRCAAAPPPPHLQHRRGHPPRRGARGGAEVVSADLSGVLRAPSDGGGRRRARRHPHRPGQSRRGGALRPRPTLRRRRPSRLRPSCRDLRGHVRADTAERRGRTRGCDGDREPLRQSDHHRPRRGPLPAREVGVVALPGGLRVRRGRRGGVDDGPGVGRPDDDLGERPAAGRLRALPQGRAALGRRRRSRVAALRTAADGHVRRQPRAPRHRRGLVPPHRVRARPARRRHRAASRGRALPVRPVGSVTAGTGLLRGLQHSGRGFGAAAARAELPEGGDRRLRRPGLHPCADRRRPRDGPRRHGRAATFWRSHFRVSPPATAPRAMRSGSPRRSASRSRSSTSGPPPS